MSSWTSIFTEANPTPFVMAFLAGYVIAAIILPSLNSALWTWFDISVFFYPCIELIIADICTSNPAVICCTTFHANFLPTFANCFCPKQTLFSNILHAAIFGTPTKIWIKVDVNLQSEPDVLLKDSLRAERLYISF